MNRLAITEITIRKRKYIAYIALDERRDFVDFQLFDSEEDTLLESIYIGRVERVLPNIGGAFVRISEHQVCYLPISEAENGSFTRKISNKKTISQGDELLVQVKKDAVKSKNPVVSAKLSLAGSYSILTAGESTLSVSKRLPAKLRSERRALLGELCVDHEEENYGVILRTNSMQASEEELRGEIRRLKDRLRRIRSQSIHLAAGTRLCGGMPGYVRRLQTVRDYSYDGIYTDSEEIFEQIAENLPYLMEQGLLRFYEDTQVSLTALYDIRGKINKLLEEKVWLPSGANLIIQTVEAMTVIDVNTAKNIRHKAGNAMGDEKLKTLLSVNREAAAEIARQLRLRNISGIIIIDFINMEDEKAEGELITFLKGELQKDMVPCQLIDVTALQLVELTRKKVHRSLAETVRGSMKGK